MFASYASSKSEALNSAVIKDFTLEDKDKDWRSEDKDEEL